MLNKKHILNNKETISLLFQSGKKVSNKNLTLLSLDNQCFSIMFSVSKRKISKAVSRNKIKRQMRAIYLKNYELFIKTKQPKAMSFIYFGNEKVEYKNLEKNMISLARKSQIE
jgi:ribonuclease P protein component